MAEMGYEVTVTMGCGCKAIVALAAEDGLERGDAAVVAVMALEHPAIARFVAAHDHADQSYDMRGMTVQALPVPDVGALRRSAHRRIRAQGRCRVSGSHADH